MAPVRRVNLFARPALRWNHRGGDAVRVSELQPRGVSAIGENERNFSGITLRLSSFDERGHVRSAP